MFSIQMNSIELTDRWHLVMVFPFVAEAAKKPLYVDVVKQMLQTAHANLSSITLIFAAIAVNLC